MKFKKLVALALTFVMATSMLAGCGNSGNSGASNNSSSTSSSSSSTDSSSTDSATPADNGGDAVTIKVTRTTFNLPQADEAQVKKVEDAINAYIADKINVQIQLEDIGHDTGYGEKVNLALANNELNLVWSASWESTIGTNDLYAAGAAYDITDLLPGTALYNSMDAGQWEASKYNGRNYFMPVYKDNVEGYDLMVRKALVDQYGWDLSSIKTLADIEPMLAQLKDDGVKYPYLTQKTGMFYRWCLDDFDFFTADGTSSFVAVDKATNEVVNTLESDTYKEFCGLMKKWYDLGYIHDDDPQKITGEQTTQTQDWGFTWWTDIPDNGEANARYGQDVEIINITNRWAHSTSNLGSCYFIAANCTEEQAKACIEFLGLLFTDSKLADIYTFGIEGEDFNYDADGLVAKTDAGKYNHSMWESASATCVTPESGQPKDLGTYYVAFNGGAKTSPAAGFRFDKSPVEGAYTACQNVYAEHGFYLENGAAGDLDAAIAAYQAALDEAGYQEVLAEFQSQYNAWK